MTENPSFAVGDVVKAASAARLRSTQDVVFVDVGARKIEPNVVRNGVPIAVHEIDADVLAEVVIGEPIIAYRIVAQTIPVGTPVPLDTSVDVVMARPGQLPVKVVKGVHDALRDVSISTAFGRLVRGKPQAQRLVARAAEGPLSGTDEQALRDLFLAGEVQIEDRPGRDVAAAVTTLRMLTTFGVDE